MDFIKGVTFGFMAPRGTFKKEEAKASLRQMKEETGCDTVIFALAALQDTICSTTVDYTGEHMVSDIELIEMIQFARAQGLKTILKPMVNCRDGMWRAHICFFDVDVPCEPKWGDWFQSYTQFQKHYAAIAAQTGCEMVIVGCEMVQTERQADHWRQLIQEVREIYTGLITYNTDKYQEDHITWWDAVDVISSSGYYPMNDWENQLQRIEKVVRQWNKPFFFAEAGCPSNEGSQWIPNDWTKIDTARQVSMEAQVQYFQTMFEACAKTDFIQGFGIWEWEAVLKEKEWYTQDASYSVHEKPAAKCIRNYFSG